MLTSDFKNGVYFKFKNDIWQIVDFQHVNPGKGSAFVRTKLKSPKTGKVIEHTFKSGDSVEDVFIETADAQYLYNDGTKYVFMDNKSYEQFEMNPEDLNGLEKYLKEGQNVIILKEEGIPFNISLPKKIQLQVTQAPPGVKGDTATGATKQITLETGLVVNAPLFINEGDTVAINTETGEYVERV